VPFNLLLLPLLGGYFLVSRTHVLAFGAAKHSGERLLFMAALVAVCLLFGSRLLVLFVVRCLPFTGEWWRVLSPWEYSGTAAGALILGIVIPLIINKFVPLAAASRSAIQKHGDGLDRLFFQATESASQVVITLATGKVYAGWLDWTPPNPGAADAYVRVLPTMSGTRTTRNRIEWTTFYQEVYLEIGKTTGEAEIEAFTKVIPISQIVTAGLFDPEAYNRFNPDQPP
jgi:hypothetical protein